LLNKFFSAYNGNIVVLLTPILDFLDSFRLYRNINRSYIGYYKINSAFTIKERKRRNNIIIATIGLYRSNLKDVVSIISPLTTELDTSIVIDINSVDTIVCIITIYFISDIPQ